jgi:Sec-independent protein secretion pathway component TatC
MSMASIIWWLLIDSILETWLANLPLGAAEGTVTVYNPHGWMATRWSMIALLSLLTTLPLAAHQLLAFADEGLLPSERKWLRTVTIFGVLTGLTAAVSWWIWIYPWAIQSAGVSGGIEGIGAQYDASMLFEVAIGISWWVFLAVVSSIALAVARLMALVSTEPFDPLRVRVHGTIVFVWWLASPDVLEGIWLVLASLLLIIPEMVQLTMPVPLLSSKARAPTSVFDKQGEIRRRMFAMCGCEGACPRVNVESAPANLGWSKVDALCLDPDERDALLDAIIRHKVTDLTISGCDGTPLPFEFRQSLVSSSCQLTGLNWLDKETNLQDRESDISALLISSQD